MSRVFDLIKAQPVYFMGLLQSTLALGISFGLHLSGEQIGAILIFSAALLSFLLQRVVTPINQPTLLAGTEVSVQGTEDKVTI